MDRCVNGWNNEVGVDYQTESCENCIQPMISVKSNKQG